MSEDALPDATTSHEEQPLASNLWHATSTAFTMEQLESLTANLTQTVGLGVAWPVNTSFPGFTSSGVSLGNFGIEVACVDPKIIPLQDWIIFTPSDVKTLVASLDARGIAHGEMKTIEIPKVGPVYSMVHLNDLENLQSSASFSYSYLGTMDGTVNRLAKEDNTATIRQVLYVDIAVDHKGKEVLKELVAPLALDDKDCIAFSTGPALRIVRESTKFETLGIVVEVEDLDKAREALVGAGLGTYSDDKESSEDYYKLKFGTLYFQLVLESA